MSDRLSSVLLFLAVSVGGGCATVPSNEPRPSSQETETAAELKSDSAQRPRSQETFSISDVRTAYVNGNYEAVVHQARERLADSLSETSTVQVHVLLGRAQQARGDHERAIEAFQAARTTAFEAGQSVVRIDRALGESYAARHRWPAAASAFQRVLDARPTDRAARQALAEAHRHARNWHEAKQQYTQLVRRDSSNGKWWARLASCEVELGEIGSAIQHFSRAHELLPHSADVALTLSRFYRATMQHDAARQVVDTTLSHRPGDSRLWRRRADLAFERKNNDRARRAYERAIATGDSSATAYRRIGLIDVRRQQYERALSALHRSLRRDSIHTRTTLYLGLSYLKLDSLQRASTYLQRTIDREAQGPITKAFVKRGALHDRRGDVRASVRAYKTALRLQPERTDVHFHLATVYDEYYREKQTAARYYRRFLRASDSTQTSLRAYARDRLETLRTTLHMQENRVRRDSAPDE